MLGAIDVGTNSIRLLIAKVEGNKINYLYKGLKTTRLGEGSRASGMLQENAIERTVEALKEFMKIINSFRVNKLRSVATSAAREALNRHVLIKKALDLGLNLEIISGEEEAWLSFKGATSVNQGIPHPLLVDIGGGSTELIYEAKGRIVSTNTPIGAINCTEENWAQLQITKALWSVLKKLSVSGKNLIGVGGTITTLAAIAQKLKNYNPDLIQGYKLDLDSIKNIRQQLASLTSDQRRLVPGLQPKRADIILAGIDILLSVMTILSKRDIIVSESDILEGIILELAAESIV